MDPMGNGKVTVIFRVVPRHHHLHTSPPTESTYQLEPVKWTPSPPVEDAGRTPTIYRQTTELATQFFWGGG